MVRATSQSEAGGYYPAMQGNPAGFQRVFPLDRIIYVSFDLWTPALTERYSIARLIGNLTRWNQQTKNKPC